MAEVRHTLDYLPPDVAAVSPTTSRRFSLKGPVVRLLELTQVVRDQPMRLADFTHRRGIAPNTDNAQSLPPSSVPIQIARDQFLHDLVGAAIDLLHPRIGI